MFKALLLSLCERRNTCLSTTFWEQICAVVSFFLFSFAVLHLHQITEHGSNSSFEPFACSKKASGWYCGLSKGPRRGVPKSECPLHQGEMSRGKAKVQENMYSSLLSSQENERLLELLGRRCVVSEVTLIRRPIMDGHSVPRRMFWGYKSIRYKRETPERTDMVRSHSWDWSCCCWYQLKVKVRLSFSSCFVVCVRNEKDEENAYKTCLGQPVTEHAVKANVFNPKWINFAISSTEDNLHYKT